VAGLTRITAPVAGPAHGIYPSHETLDHRRGYLVVASSNKLHFAACCLVRHVTNIILHVLVKLLIFEFVLYFFVNLNYDGEFVD
jgi:hypothetical protein